MCSYQMGEAKRRRGSQALVSDAQDKRRWTLTKIEEISPKHKKAPSSCEGGQTLVEIPGEVVEPPSLEILKIQ